MITLVVSQEQEALTTACCDCVDESIAVQFWFPHDFSDVLLVLLPLWVFCCLISIIRARYSVFFFSFFFLMGPFFLASTLLPHN